MNGQICFEGIMMDETYKNLACELLAGSYEMHVHTAPSHYPRIMDDWEYAAGAL